jgi:16S rRNA (cytidine1402-2'-O)-methyltransferase
MSGKLFLLPNLLDESIPSDFPPSVVTAVHQIQGLICESEKSARKYLRRFISHDEMAKMPLRLLNEHTQKGELENLLAPILNGEIWGLISDAGLPCIADPGSDLVYLAHQKNVSVETFVGPCSIIMALQLSGFSGQNFSFHGYLPRDPVELVAKIKELEKLPGVQIWIEAPYRTAKMLDTLKEALLPTTILSIASSLHLPEQRVLTKPISQWKNLSMGKEPAIFLISRRFS